MNPTTTFPDDYISDLEAQILRLKTENEILRHRNEMLKRRPATTLVKPIAWERTQLFPYTASVGGLRLLIHDGIAGAHLYINRNEYNFRSCEDAKNFAQKFILNIVGDACASPKDIETTLPE